MVASFDLENISEYLLHGKDPNRIALLTLTGEHTYGDIKTAAQAAGACLLRSGAQMGDRVLLLADNSLFWVAAYLGIMRVGMVAVPLAPSTSSGELAYINQLADASFAFVQAKYLPSFTRAVSESQIITDVSLQQYPSVAVLNEHSVDQSSEAHVQANDVAALMFTSGSTGKPRGVVVTHGNLIANTRSIITFMELTADDRVAAVLPFHYCFGASLLHTHLRVGGSLVLEPRFMFPEAVLQRINAMNCTGFAGVPSHYQILLRKSNLARMNFSSLRYVQQAGGHLSPIFIEELRQALPHTAVYVMYGQTEATARLAYLPPEMLTRKPGSIGKAIPGVTLSVLDVHGCPVRAGQVGEIVAEGPNITKGYWRDDAATARSFRNGRLYTGDLATVDEDGFIFIVDRASDFLKCGGKRVSCRQIESVLLEFQNVQEAAVIGIPDPVLGEAARAYVVACDSQADFAESLRNHCRTRLPAALVPRDILVVSSLPKNSSGKVLKPALSKC